MATKLCALWEVLRRGSAKEIKFEITRSTETLNSPEKGAKFFRKIWDKELLTEQEQVYIILVDHKYRPIAHHCIHTGGVCETIIDFRVVISHVIKYKPTGFFIAHNHPSGSVKASEIDIELTNKLKVMSDMIRVELLDHIILTEKSYSSFQESGLLD